jgi:H+-transporting ATPase
MEQKIAIFRDGKAEHMLTRLLVPGDVVLLLGGVQVPADIEWFDGDILQVDTAALTGEPLPRKYPSKEHGNLILCASTIRAGEAYGIVRKTGTNTEIGSTNVDIMKDKTVAKVSVFEQKVLQAVRVIISIALVDVIVIFIVQGTVRKQFNMTDITTDFLTCLSIIVAAIPVALPIVMQVTMALGAGKMAREYNSVVTALPALQDIASMTILCSDKTGTLTTARISIHAESVWCSANFTKQDVALYAVLASNRDKKEDAIDASGYTGIFHRTKKNLKPITEL